MGTVALWVSVVLAMGAVVHPVRLLLRLAAIAATFATGTLGFALLTHDFSLAYVAETTSFATPWPYRLAAIWGGMNGSMLFYTAMTLSVGAFAVSRRTPLRVVGAYSVFLCVLTLGFANPFQTLAIPAVDGVGLLAILQHPAMIYHPPILYAGLAFLVVPFAHLVETAVEARPEWLTTTRRHLYVAWTLLTVGMAAGANWAYIELGWGGFWAWDPVENTALMPWLAITIFLHSSRLEEKRGRMRRWNATAVGTAFALSVVGVYLTRSGATGSIHSFAEDPIVGRVLFGAAVVVVGVVAVVALRRERGTGWGTVKLDTDGWLAVNSIVLSIALVFIAAGTIYPAAASVFQGESLLVDSRFFVTTVLPLAVIIGMSLAISLGSAWLRWGTVVLLAAIGTLLIVGAKPGVALFAPALASLGGLTFRLGRRVPSGRRLIAHIGHIGMTIVLVAFAGSSFGDDFSGSMRAGDSVEVSGHTIVVQSITTGEADRYIYARADIDVDGRRLTPEIRAYEDQRLPVAEPAIRSTVVDDVIVAVSLLFPDGETVDVSVFVRPMVLWVWVGAAIVALAGLVSLFGRVGDGGVRRRMARGELQPGGTTTGTASR